MVNHSARVIAVFNGEKSGTKNTVDYANTARIGEEIGNQTVEFSDRFKRNMNRLFRKKVGSKKALHPEVDNVYERIRSFIVRKWLLVKKKG